MVEKYVLRRIEERNGFGLICEGSLIIEETYMKDFDGFHVLFRHHVDEACPEVIGIEPIQGGNPEKRMYDWIKANANDSMRDFEGKINGKKDDNKDIGNYIDDQTGLDLEFIDSPIQFDLEGRI